MKLFQRITSVHCIPKTAIWSLAVAAMVTSGLAAHYTVATINDLKNTVPANGDSVLVLDYYANSAGTYLDRGRGGGLFRAVPTTDVPLSADDGGRYVKHVSNTSYIWERDFQGDVPNVKMWGATGNGTSDDTVAIQKAVSGVRGSPSWANRSRAAGNELLFPSGTYLITNTIVIPGMIFIRGEGANNASTVMMSTNHLDRDIFRTLDADNYIKGWAAGSPAIAASGSWYYNVIGGATNIINFNPLRIQEIALTYGGYQSAGQSSAAATGAAICMTLPLETSEIRNIWTFGGGYGVRVIGGGTPGVKVHNSGFFYQAIASVCVEGLKYRDTSNGPDKWAAYGGASTLSSLAGDSFYSGQAAQNSFILFTNHAPAVSISDLSLEGAYGQGAIRVVLPPGATTPFSYMRIRNGTFDSSYSPSGVVKDFVVLRNPHSDSSKMPEISIDATTMHGIRNIISDEWAGRYIPASTWNANQLPVRRPLYYTSATTYYSEKRSLLVHGDTAYLSFIPTTTGWKRVLLTYGADTVFGGRLAINSYSDSSEFSFNFTPTFGEITVNRTSKNLGSAPWLPCISKVRGYTIWQGSGYREAIDIYVANIISTNSIREQQEITLTLPLEGRTELFSGLANLITPIDLESNSANATPNPAVSGETYYGAVGPINLLR